MSGPMDVPDLPFTKPQQLIDLEQIGTDRLNAMTKAEAYERIEEAAYALANNYRKEKGGDYDSCVDLVSMALRVTGGAIDSKVGPLMIAESEKLAQEACRVIFTDDTLEY